MLDVTRTSKGEGRVKGPVIVSCAARGFDCSVHRLLGWPSLFDDNCMNPTRIVLPAVLSKLKLPGWRKMPHTSRRRLLIYHHHLEDFCSHRF